MAKSMQQLTHINTTGMGFFYDHNAGIQCLFYEVNLGIRYDVNAVGYTQSDPLPDHTSRRLTFI